MYEIFLIGFIAGITMGASCNIIGFVIKKGFTLFDYKEL